MWWIRDEGDLVEITDGRVGICQDVFDHSRDSRRKEVLENFERIVACLNFCDGRSMDELEDSMIVSKP